MATMTETRPGLTINKAVQQLYTLEQVARHKTANDLWIAIHGKGNADCTALPACSINRH
jgi:cytochrome b involved in lipid metabolism